MKATIAVFVVTWLATAGVVIGADQLTGRGFAHSGWLILVVGTFASTFAGAAAVTYPGYDQ